MAAVKCPGTPEVKSPQSVDHVNLSPIAHSLSITPRPKSVSRTPTPEYSGGTIKSYSASSDPSAADETLSLADIENLLSEKLKHRKEDLMVAFDVFDYEGTSTVTRGEFRRVIEGFLLPLTDSQFETLLSLLRIRSNGTVPYMEFFERFCKDTFKVRRYSGETGKNMSLGRLQCCLKDKIGGKVKTVTKAFRLFDYNHDGYIQKHEFRKVLESYCFLMSNPEFQRLWSHYRAKNENTIFYKDFLEKLGADCENYRKIIRDPIELALKWDLASHSSNSKSTGKAISVKSTENLDKCKKCFLSEMKKNFCLVEKALRAFDFTDSGFVSQADLKSVLNNFVFHMDDRMFTRLMDRFGVRTSDAVNWRMFLDLFTDHESVQSDAVPVTSEETVSELSDASSHSQTPLMESVKVERRRKQAEKAPAQINTWVSSSAETLKTVEGILKEKLLENYYALMESITTITQNQSNIIPLEDLRRFVQKHGLPLSKHHFGMLCQPFLEDGGVNYKLFLKNMGVLQRHEEEPDEVKASTDSVKKEAVEAVVMRKLRDKLQDRGQTLQDCFVSSRPGQTQALTLKDFSQILETFGIFLERLEFEILIESLGFKSGQLPWTEFVAKYNEATGNEQNKEGQENTPFLSAEDCLIQLHTRIKERHGNTLAAFCFMDRNKDGSVDRNDFRTLFNGLGFTLKEQEYQRLLGMLGFELGATRSLSHFNHIIVSSGTAKPQHIKPLTDEKADKVCEQIQQYLAEYFISHDRPSQLSKVFCKHEESGEIVLTKIGLKRLLYKFNLPISPFSFEKLWDSYFPDEKVKDFITRVEFLRKLKIVPEEDNQSEKSEDQASDESIPTTFGIDTVLQDLRMLVRKRFAEVSRALLGFDSHRDGHVTTTALLSLLHRHGFPLSQSQLSYLLNHLGVATAQKKLSYIDFLKRVSGLSVSNGSVQNVAQTPSTDRMENLEELSSGRATSVDKIENPEELSTGRATFQDEIENPEELSTGRYTVMDEMENSEELSNGSATFMEEMVNPEDQSTDRAIHKVKEIAALCSDTLKRAFLAFDKTGEGLIARGGFRQVLNHFCLSLSDVQFKKLLFEMNLGEDEEINWKEFLKVINHNKHGTADEWMRKIHKMRFPTQARPLPINDILKRLQEVVSARLYTITTEMVKLDFINTDTISKNDFRRICDSYFMRLTDEQFQGLWKMLPVNNCGHLEYREFLKKFSGEQEAKVSRPGSANSSTPTSDSSTSSGRPKTAPCSSSFISERRMKSSTASMNSMILLNCEEVEMKVQPKIQNCWRNIQAKCREVDTERTGEIDMETFQEILQSLHFELSVPEFKQLAIKYDVKNTGRLSYPKFLRHFVLMFNSQVKTSDHRIKLQLSRTTTSSGPLSDQCVEAMVRISKPVRLIWRQMRQQFLSFDKERSGKIYLQDFRQVLRQYSLNLSEDEFIQVASIFDTNLSGRIAYNDFLRALLK